MMLAFALGFLLALALSPWLFTVVYCVFHRGPVRWGTLVYPRVRCLFDLDDANRVLMWVGYKVEISDARFLVWWMGFPGTNDWRTGIPRGHRLYLSGLDIAERRTRTGRLAWQARKAAQGARS
jgi:hypothetical protein